jgi:hypothetical protein
VISSQHLAGHFGLLLNTGDAARREITCDRDKKDMGDTPQPGNMYMMAPAARDPFNNSVPLLFQRASKAGDCYEWEQRVVCLPGVDKALVLQSSLGMKPYQFPDHPVVLWNGSDFFTQSGVPENGKMVNQPDQTGWVHGGPFVGLPAGHYQARLHFSSAWPQDKEVGETQLAFSEERTLQSAATVVKSFPIKGTAGREGSLQFDFTVSKSETDKPLNIRTKVRSGAPFTLHDLQLERLP